MVRGACLAFEHGVRFSSQEHFPILKDILPDEEFDIEADFVSCSYEGLYTAYFKVLLFVTSNLSQVYDVEGEPCSESLWCTINIPKGSKNSTVSNTEGINTLT